ncbi:MAG: beta-lactamase family protein [Saprospiraceae bacterium]|nr:beta-lactamase family protein [Saprospiraceae bacterium]
MALEGIEIASDLNNPVKQNAYQTSAKVYNYGIGVSTLALSCFSGIPYSLLEDIANTPSNIDDAIKCGKCLQSIMPGFPIQTGNSFDPNDKIGQNGVTENHYFNGIVGDKGVYASTMDLYKLDRALYEAKFIDQNLLAEAFSPQSPDLTNRHRDNYGLGWRIQQPSEFGNVVYHGGWWKGFKTYFIRMIDKNQTIIVLTNVTRGGYLDKMEMERLF